MDNQDQENHDDADIYKPWRRATAIYCRGNTEIYTLKNYPDWLMKVYYTDISANLEINFIQLTVEEPCRNQVQIYSDPSCRFAIHDSCCYWYIMRKYTAPSLKQLDTNWQQVGLHILQFLEDVHRKYRRVHMDIKSTNILYESERNRYIVSDYGLCESPRTILTREVNTDFRYYYYRFGAVPDQPFVSYRMDLTMLAYLLLDLTWPSAEAPGFDAAFIRRRNNPRERTPPESAMFAMRDAAIAKASPVVRSLLAAIDRAVPWVTDEPPSASFYEELTDILSSVSAPVAVSTSASI